MTIKAEDQIPKDHFAGGAHLTGATLDDLIEIINQMKAGNARLALAGDSGQTAVDTNDHMEWIQSTKSGTLISVSTGAGQLAGIITLKKDHTYRISFSLDIAFDLNTVTMKAQVFNVTLGAKLIPDGGTLDPRISLRGTLAVSVEVGMSSISFDFTPVVDTDISVRFEAVTGGGALDFINASSWMTVDALN